MAGRLDDAASPYLRSRAADPVGWWPWCAAAFEQARDRDIPVLISVGYLGCAASTRMGQESFTDPVIVELMNRHFVNVLVDRQEHPDVDATCLAAIEECAGRAGWPATVFTTGWGEPFRATGYLPATGGPGSAGFADLLREVAAGWTDRRPELEVAALRMVEALGRGSVHADLGRAPDAALPARVVTVLCAHEDARHGGFGGAPKFPNPTLLFFLMRHHHRTGSGPAARLLDDACQVLSRSAIQDHLAGGFARCTFDAAWSEPSGEKLLADNALLLRLFAHRWQRSRSAEDRATADATADWLRRELWVSNGGFGSSATTIDTESGQRRWSRTDLVEVLGARDGTWFAVCAGIPPTGSAIPSRVITPDDPDRWDAACAALRGSRAAAPRPVLDRTVVAAWNGLAVSALAEAGVRLDRPELITSARATAEVLLERHTVPAGAADRLLRINPVGHSAFPGVLEDYGHVAEGYLALHAVSGEQIWVDRAERVLASVLTCFADGARGLRDTAADTDPWLARPPDWCDAPLPAGRSAAAGALFRFAVLTGSARHGEVARAALAPAAAVATRAATAVGWALAVAEEMLDPALVLAQPR